MRVELALVYWALPLVVRAGLRGVAATFEVEPVPRPDGGADRHLRASDAATDDLDPSPDVWIVEFQPGTAGVTAAASEVAQAGQGRVGFVYRHALQGFVYHGRSVERLRGDPRVRSVTRDAVSRVAAQTTPTGLRRIYADTKRYMRRASATCHCDAVVAVIDTGVDFQHPDLRVDTANSVDCTLGAATAPRCVAGLGDDENGHGTHVAGTIAAISNADGVVGVCPGATIWAVKVLNSRGVGYNSWILAGIDYVTSHAGEVDVANMSLGGSGCDATYCEALNRTKAAGIAIAVAAGNENALASTTTPACCSAVMTVSSLSDSDGAPGGVGPSTCSGRPDDVISSYSNYGSAVDIAAPGDCILSTVPGGYARYSGTSMASPHVAGALAVLASQSHDGRVNAYYRKLRERGNYNYTDKAGDTAKEPLLDLRNLAGAAMVGTC